MNDKTTGICSSLTSSSLATIGQRGDGFGANEVHMGRLPHRPLTVFERTGVAQHQSLARDYLANCDLARDRQQRANFAVRKHHSPIVSRVNRRNSAIANALRPAPTFAVGGWA